tara:strand:+ start:805 stop:1059 length:255 start_codon:yes stop_codon:yes gene_type:complete
MTEVILFIGGSVFGMVLTLIASKSGSRNAHQAYDIIYTPPEQQDLDGTEPTLTGQQLYDWDEYNSGIRFQEFEKDDDDLEKKPN